MKSKAIFLSIIILLSVGAFAQIRVGYKNYVRYRIGDMVDVRVVNSDSIPRPNRSLRFYGDSLNQYIEFYVESDTVRFRTNMPLDHTSKIIVDHLLEANSDYIYWSKVERDRVGKCLARARQKLAENGILFECDQP